MNESPFGSSDFRVPSLRHDGYDNNNEAFKKMYVGQLAKITGVSVRTIRHYETLGLITPSGQDDHFRTYDDSHVHTIKMIRMAQSVGFKLRDIIDVIHSREISSLPVEKANGLLDRRSTELAIAIGELNKKREVVDQLKKHLVHYCTG